MRNSYLNEERFVVAILLLSIFQIVGYYTIGKKSLVSKLISERERIVDIDDVDIVNVNSNYEFTLIQKGMINRIFENRPLSYYVYQNIDHVPGNRMFPEDTLCYTLNITDFLFPIAIVTQSETIRGFGAHDSLMYAWILFFWIEVKYISGGIS